MVKLNKAQEYLIKKFVEFEALHYSRYRENQDPEEYCEELSEDGKEFADKVSKKIFEQLKGLKKLGTLQIYNTINMGLVDTSLRLIIGLGGDPSYNIRLCPCGNQNHTAFLFKSEQDCGGLKDLTNSLK